MNIVFSETCALNSALDRDKAKKHVLSYLICFGRCVRLTVQVALFEPKYYLSIFGRAVGHMFFLFACLMLLQPLC
jgi:hypothetical protein